MHACQVRWFERMPDREVVELDETDVNPAGCLAGIAPVVFADTREQVCFLAWHLPHGTYRMACPPALCLALSWPLAFLGQDTCLSTGSL